MLYPGETLESKAKAHGVLERDIRVVNGLGLNEVPEVGTIIRIPIPIGRNGVINPSDKRTDPTEQSGAGIASYQPRPMSEHEKIDFELTPYSYFPTNLSHGYSLSYRVYRDVSDDHVMQCLTLVRGNQDIKKLSGMSYGLLQKNLGYIGADFDDTFLFVQSWGGGNPHDIQLIDKATGAIITEGTWVSVNEEEGLFLYLHDIFESTAELRLYDTRNKKETVIDVRDPIINLRTVWDSWSEISVSNSPFSDEYILDYWREGEAYRKRYDK
ncbi:hypothetical protein P4C99_15225 [Pontiellaceae bacterium B1224]|nr:hypothetical protein [Pontiellaceae bacterium B1224]